MVAANGIYKLAVIGTVVGQQHIHTLHFRSNLNATGLARTEADWMQNLIDHWQANARTEYRAMFYGSDSPCVLYQVRKVCGSLPLPGGVDESEIAGNIAGTSAGGGTPAAPWLAQVVTLRTAYAGRRYRGRSFIGGLDESDITIDQIGVNHNNKLAAYFGKLKTVYVDGPGDVPEAKLFVYSRTQSQVPGTPCQESGADVTNYVVRTTLATMKSRKAGSGL